MNSMNYQKMFNSNINKTTEDLINELSIVNGPKYFSSGIFQKYLVFTPAKKYIKYFNSTTRMDSEKSNGMYLMKENIENITKSDSNFGQTFLDHHLLPDTNFNGHCLIKQYFYP